MRPLTAKDRELLKNFDALPDDAIVGDKHAALLLGVSWWTLQRHPILPRIPISPSRFGRRVGDIRALARGHAA